MAIKELKTRIALRTGDYAYWTTGAGKDIELYKGEVCVCTVAKADNQAQTAPTVLFKVANENGQKFGDLDWCSALAADVYEWAKKPEDEFITWVNTVVEHPAAPVITTGSANGTIAVDGTDVAVKGLGSAAFTDAGAYATAEQGGKADSAAAAIATYGDIVTHNAAEFAPADIDTGVRAVDLATGDANGQVKLTVDGESKNVDVKGLASAAYVTVDSLNETAKGYADAVEAKIPTELGVMSVAAGDDTITIGGDGKAVTVKVTENKFDAHGAAAQALADAKAYADQNDANTEYHVEYDSTAKKIKLVAGADASKMEIDATDFIKDGMIETVELVQQDGEGNKGQFLKLTWNDDGKDVTYVPVGALVDVYTAAKDATEVQVAISNTNEVSATIVNGGVTEEKLAEGVKTKLNKVWEDVGVAAGLDATLKAELQKEIDDDVKAAIEAEVERADKAYDAINSAANVKTAVENGTIVAAKATDADKLGGQLPAYYATAQSVTDITKDNGVIDTKIATFDSTLGALAKKDNITHDLVTDFDTAVKAIKVDAAVDADKLGGVAAAEYALKSDIPTNHLTEITTTENGGLKVTNKNHIDIDTEVIFLLNANF
jgi:hypothetical protein